MEMEKSRREINPDKRVCVEKERKVVFVVRTTISCSLLQAQELCVLSKEQVVVKKERERVSVKNFANVDWDFHEPDTFC